MCGYVRVACSLILWEQAGSPLPQSQTPYMGTYDCHSHNGVAAVMDRENSSNLRLGVATDWLVSPWLSPSPCNFLKVCFSTSRFALSAKAAHIFCCIGLCAENFYQSFLSFFFALECGRNTNGAEKPRLHTQMNKASKWTVLRQAGCRSWLTRQRWGFSPSNLKGPFHCVWLALTPEGPGLQGRGKTIMGINQGGGLIKATFSKRGVRIPEKTIVSQGSICPSRMSPDPFQGTSAVFIAKADIISEETSGQIPWPHHEATWFPSSLFEGQVPVTSWSCCWLCLMAAWLSFLKPLAYVSQRTCSFAA